MRIASNWWAMALRGVLAIIFGILALIWPWLNVLTLVMFFGAYAFVDGIFAAISGISSIGSNTRWWAMVLVGFVGIIIGLLKLFNPGITALVLVTYIAAWAIAPAYSNLSLQFNSGGKLLESGQ